MITTMYIISAVYVIVWFLLIRDLYTKDTKTNNKGIEVAVETRVQPTWGVFFWQLVILAIPYVNLIYVLTMGALTLAFTINGNMYWGYNRTPWLTKLKINWTNFLKKPIFK